MQTQCFFCERKQITFCSNNEATAVELRCQACGYHFLVYYDEDEALPRAGEITLENCSRCKDETPCKVSGAGENAKCPHKTFIRTCARGAVSLVTIIRRNFKSIFPPQKSKIQYNARGK